MWYTILGTLLAAGLALLLFRRFRREVAERKTEPQRMFADVLHLLDEASAAHGETAGALVLTGRYQGRDVRVTVLTDTLALRKLPSLWLMVTLPAPLPVTSALDLMMRPAAATSFSNFDHLAYTLETPEGFPEDLVIRSDAPAMVLPADVLDRHLGPLRKPRGKELLITPKGLRLVVQMAEADRARYGVFRQADFGGASVSAAALQEALEHLLGLQRDILAWHDRAK